MEIESALRRVLLSDATVASLTSKMVWKFRLEEKLDGTGRCAIVVWRDNGWSIPDEIHTNEFPLVNVDCYADTSRDAAGRSTMLDAEDRAYGLYRNADRVIRSMGRGKWWGAVGSDPGVMVNSVQRWNEPFKTGQSDQHSGAPPLGDVVFVRARYAFDLVH